MYFEFSVVVFRAKSCTFSVENVQTTNAVNVCTQQTIRFLIQRKPVQVAGFSRLQNWPIISSWLAWVTFIAQYIKPYSMATDAPLKFGTGYITLVSNVHFNCIVQDFLYHNMDISTMWHCALVNCTPSQFIGQVFGCALGGYWVCSFYYFLDRIFIMIVVTIIGIFMAILFICLCFL